MTEKEIKPQWLKITRSSETIYSNSTAHIHKQNDQTKKSNDLIYYCSLPVLFGVLKVLLVMSRFQKIALDDADDADARS